MRIPPKNSEEEMVQMNLQYHILTFMSGYLCYWLHFLTVLVSVTSSVSGANVSWCIDSREQLFNLSCDFDSRIRILRVTHSWTNITSQSLNETECASLPKHEGCVENYPNVALLLNSCSGLESCVFSSVEIPASLRTCEGIKSNYVFVEYECISVRNQTTSTDICGRGMKAVVPPKSLGYITSPNYPRRYDSSTKCSCVLEVIDEVQRSNANEIVLEILDFDISLIPNERNPFDWLRYGGVNRNWGDGRLLSAEYRSSSSVDHRNSVHTGLNRVVLNFNSDERIETRGFWFKYYGLNVLSNEELRVGINCSVYTPPETRQAVSCLETPHAGELYLSCAAYGVINILQVTAGYRSSNKSADSFDQRNRSCTPEAVMAQAACTSTVDISEVGSQCMRRIRCNPPIPSFWNLTKCNRPNDFVIINYQCIPVDSSQVGAMMDICGEDVNPGISLINDLGVGFLSSPLYPSRYPPSCNCFCSLEITSMSKAQVIIYIMDLKLSQNSEGGGNAACSSSSSGEGECNNDWLEYGMIGQKPGTGNLLSPQMIGKPVYTGQNIISLNFHSDSDFDDRGFWIKYVGRSVQGKNVPLKVRCGHFTSATLNQTVLTSTTASGGTSDYSNDGKLKTAGLIIGLTLLTACLAFVLLLSGIVLWHRFRYSSAGVLSGSRTDSLEVKLGSSVWRSPGSDVRNTEIWRRMGSMPFTVFYNEAYKTQDPTLYQGQRYASSGRKRNMPADETLHL